MSYEIGHKIWLVRSRYVEPQKKTDENGVVWKMVTFDHEHYIVEAEVIGKITMNIEGYNLWDDEPFYDQYAIKTSDGHIDSVASVDMEGQDWGMDLVFHSEEDAKEWITQREKLNK